MASKLWGEFEDEPENDQQNVNLDPIIELGMQNIPEIPITVKIPPVELPEHNLITHTIHLHEYYRELQTIPVVIKKALAKNLKSNLVIHDLPPLPENINAKHKSTPGVNFLPKAFNEFTAGKGPVILPFTKESHQRALKKSAATVLAFLGALDCTETVVDAMANALDIFLSKFCCALRDAEDKKARNIPIGFPDAISRVLHDLNIKNLDSYYQDFVVNYNADLQKKCRNYANTLKLSYTDDDVSLEEMEEVPELHFPASMDGSITPALETGFQMLHNLEQGNLDGLEFMEMDGQQPKPESK